MVNLALSAPSLCTMVSVAFLFFNMHSVFRGFVDVGVRRREKEKGDGGCCAGAAH